MSWISVLLSSCLPVFLEVAFAAIVLKYALQLLFKLSHIPNYSTSSPSGLHYWRRPAPPDILFRLAALAALNLVLYWMPIYYWTTYAPSGDERDGGVLFPSMLICPLSWILGGLWYAEVWRHHQLVSPRYRAAFQITSALLLLVVLSTIIPQVQFYVRMSRF